MTICSNLRPRLLKTVHLVPPAFRLNNDVDRRNVPVDVHQSNLSNDDCRAAVGSLSYRVRGTHSQRFTTILLSCGACARAIVEVSGSLFSHRRRRGEKRCARAPSKFSSHTSQQHAHTSHTYVRWCAVNVFIQICIAHMFMYIYIYIFSSNVYIIQPFSPRVLCHVVYDYDSCCINGTTCRAFIISF